MTKRINKDTQVCMSLAARPSNFGTRFHNYLYEALDLNYLYKAFSPTDLTQAISGVRGLGIRGCAILCRLKKPAFRWWMNWMLLLRPFTQLIPL